MAQNQKQSDQKQSQDAPGLGKDVARNDFPQSADQLPNHNEKQTQPDHHFTGGKFDDAKPTPGAGVSGTHDGIGPQTIDGVEAGDLPGGGRGSVETDFGKEAARNVPQRTGGVIGGEVGIRGTPDAAAADEDGGRGEN